MKHGTDLGGNKFRLVNKKYFFPLDFAILSILTFSQYLQEATPAEPFFYNTHWVYGALTSPTFSMGRDYVTLLLKNSDFVLRNPRALNFATPPSNLGFRPSMESPSSPCFSPFSGLAVCGQEYRSFRGNDARPKAMRADTSEIHENYRFL